LSVEEVWVSKAPEGKRKSTKTVSMQASVGGTCDGDILKAMEPVVEGLAQFFGKHFEVVLHTASDMLHSVTKIENGSVTGRTVGAPMTDYGIELLKRAAGSDENVVESYLSLTNDGRTLRSLSVVIRNAQGKPIGALCVNMDLSAPLLDYLQLDPSEDAQFRPRPEEKFPSSASELVRASLSRALSGLESQHNISSTKRNRMIVAELYGMGVFDIKDATRLVAQEMGVSVYTVYNYLREARFARKRDNMLAISGQ
jgi:predicted transcriptional regulator YheO